MSASLPATGRGLAAPPKPTEPLSSGPGAGWSPALPSAARAEPRRTAARARVPPCKHPGRRGGSKAVRDPGSTAGTRPRRGRGERAGPPSRWPPLPGRCRHRTSCLAGGGWGRGKPPRLTEKLAEQFGFPEGAKCCFFSSSAEIQAALSWGFPPAGGRGDVCVRTEPAKGVGNNFCGQCQHRRPQPRLAHPPQSLRQPHLLLSCPKKDRRYPAPCPEPSCSCSPGCGASRAAGG